MKKLALGALFVGLIAACGGNDDNGHKIVLDGSNGSGTDGGTPTCNPLMQTGCNAGEKCTWIIDATDPQYVGHVGCVMDGTKNVGDACTFGAAGDDFGAGIDIGQDNSVLFTGRFRGTTDIDPTAGVKRLRGLGIADGYVTNFDENGLPI